MEFTDLGPAGFGGSSILAHTARRFGLFELLGEAAGVKVRDRGASDAGMLWSMIASLARGRGALSDLDALRADAVARALPGLVRAPESRRAGEWLSRLRVADVKGLREAAREFAERVVPEIVAYGTAPRGHVPVRRRTEHGQGLPVPGYTVTPVSRNDLGLKELVHRHRGKQGQV